MTSTVCPNCKRPIRPGARFCGNCGAVLQPAQQVAVPNQATPQQATVQQIRPPTPQPTPQPTPPQHQPQPSPIPPQRPQPNQQGQPRPQGTPQPSKKCPKCGAAVRPNVRFCGKCGALVDKPRRRWLLVLLLILLAMGIIAGAYFLFTFLKPGSGPVATPVAISTEVSQESNPPIPPPATKIPPTAVIIATEAKPTEQPVMEAQSTKPPAPTDTMNPTPSPTATNTLVPPTPVPPLIEENFADPISDRWVFSGTQPELKTDDPKSIELKGIALSDVITSIKQFEMKNGTVITFTIKGNDFGNLGFRWDPMQNNGLAPFQAAPLSMLFENGKVRIHYAFNADASSDCSAEVKIMEPVHVKIAVLDNKTGISINDQPIAGCSAALAQPFFIGQNHIGQISFVGSGSLMELKVIDRP